MVKVVIVNGMPGCGKTTFETKCDEICYCGNNLGFSTNRPLYIKTISTVDRVKQIARNCGWDGEKNLKNRKFLSDLKTLLVEWDDIPCRDAEQWARDLSTGEADWILFVDCREPAEIQKLKERLNATTVLIRRDSVEYDEVSNHADSDVFYYDYDLTIYNNSDIIHLEDAARKFIEYMKKEEVPHYVNVD